MPDGRCVGGSFEELRARGVEVVDCGPGELVPGDDYPDAAAAVGRAVVSGGADRGILVCGSGVGASIAASKLTGVRCALCHDPFSARQGVEDDDMNVLALGARVIGPDWQWSSYATSSVRGSLVRSVTAAG